MHKENPDQNNKYNKKEDTIHSQNEEKQKESKKEDLNEEQKEEANPLEEENKNLNDKILRLAAEIENTRKRSKEEIDKISKYAVANFASDIVVVAENFYLASDNLPKEDMEKSPSVKQFIDGMLMTKKELMKTLEKYDIHRIYPINEKFDHNFHEAISQIPTENEEENQTIKQVVQAGYKIKDRLIKPALVVVATKQ